MIDAIKLHSMELEDNVNKRYTQLATWNIPLEKICRTVGNDCASRIVDVVCCGRKKYTFSLKPDNVRTLIFWSKDQGQFLRKSDLNRILQKCNLFFHFVIIRLARIRLEPNVKSWISIIKKKKKLVSGFQNKSNRLKVRRRELNLEAS
jgi:hypothetical protein